MLEKEYNLISALKKEFQAKEPETLDQIARIAVDLCWDFLFTSAHLSNEYSAGKKLEYLRGWIIEGGMEGDDSRHPITFGGVEESTDGRIRTSIVKSNYLHEIFALPLCDHLITTFAYRFYCDNTKQRDVKEYLEYLTLCTYMEANDTKVESTDAIRGHKNTLKKTLDSNWKKMKDEIASIMKSSGLDEEDGVMNTLMQAPNWLFSLVIADNWAGNIYKLRNIGGQETLKFEDPKYDIGKANLFYDLTNFFQKNRHLSLLLQEWEHESQDLFSMRFLYEGYDERLILPWRNSEKPREADVEKVKIHMDDDIVTVFESLEGEQKIKIPPEIQRVFHCFLLERNFHCLAFAKIKAIQMLHADIQPEDMENITIPLRLRAPLMQSSLIDVMFRTNRKGSWLAKYIEYWNSVALPILEELFLWGVRERFSDEKIWKVIEESFTKETSGQMTYGDYAGILDSLSMDIRCLTKRCDRLNSYQIVKTRRIKTDKEYLKERKFNNDMIRTGLYNAIIGMGEKTIFDT